MSNRALRRLRGDSDLEILARIGQEGSDQSLSDEEDAKPVKKPGKQQRHKANPFDLLNEDEIEPTASDGENEEIENKESQSTKAETNVKQARKKKKNKKKGKENKMATTVKSTDEDVESSIQEVNRLLGEPSLIATSTNSAGRSLRNTYKPLLHIDFRNLNPETELKRIFGSQVIRGDQQNRPRRRNQQLRRSSRLVQSKENWHSTGGSGLSMKFMGEDEGFLFEHSTNYQKMQHRFLTAVESGHPEAIFVLLEELPYHIDTLIQMSDFYRMNEDRQTAAQCIEKAIYGMEAAFHPLFNFASGNCYLNYKYKENRALHICIFKHILNLGSRGCYRTAFEFCKLLLSLDPSGDPLEALYLIDFYALRSSQYQFLINIANEVANSTVITERVNFAFSIPLAMFHQASQTADEELMGKADAMLQDKLLLYPGMLMQLLDRCNVNPDKRVHSHTFFNTHTDNDDRRELYRITKLYCERCFHCWKEPEVLSWLERNVTVVMDIVDAGSDCRPAEYANKRQARFKGAPKALLRHYVLCEFPGIGLPRGVANRESIVNHDPFPPSDGVQAYSAPERRTMASTSRSGLVASLLQSLLPTYDPNAINEADPRELALADAAGAAGGGIPGNFRQGVNAVMDAMRALLNDVQFVGVQAPEDENPGDGAEWNDGFDDANNEGDGR